MAFAPMFFLPWQEMMCGISCHACWCFFHGIWNFVSCHSGIAWTFLFLSAMLSFKKLKYHSTMPPEACCQFFGPSLPCILFLYFGNKNSNQPVQHLLPLAGNGVSGCSEVLPLIFLKSSNSFIVILFCPEETNCHISCCSVFISFQKLKTAINLCRIYFPEAEKTFPGRKFVISLATLCSALSKN